MRKVHISNRWRLLSFLMFMLTPGLLIGYFVRSWAWIILWPGLVLVLVFIAAALPIRCKITPEAWADRLDKHLDGADVYAWDDATSAEMANPRMERLCRKLIDRGFGDLDSDEKREELRQIIRALRHGEIPDS